MHRIERLKPGDDRGFAELLAIYQAAIEPSEQKPADVLAALLADARYHVHVALSHTAVIGFVIVFVPEDGAFWLLEYMAVSSDRRSRGIGEALFHHTVDVMTREGVGPGILEVDEPGGAVSVGNEVDRRLRFYARLGCRKLAGLHYLLPLAHAGTPPPMMILVRPRHGESDVPRALVRRWLRTLYVDVYQQADDDPRIAGMVSGLPERVSLISVSQVSGNGPD